MKRLFVCLVLFNLAACNNQNDKMNPNSGFKHAPLAKSVNSPAFNASFNFILNAYFDLNNGFIAEKDSGIAQSARALMIAADSLKLNELKADSNLINTAKSYSEGISAELKGLLGETEMLAKRRSFQMISDQLYDLVRTVQYDQKMLFHFYCPTAFDDQGAYWISDKSNILNPYLPKKIPVCRDIRDTIQFVH